MGGALVTDCTDCPAGKACPFTGITDVNSAVSCDYGHYCPLKTEYPNDNACPIGKYTDSTSLTVDTACSDCPEGYYCPTVGTNTFTNPPVECPAGYYCPTGTSVGTANPCPAGTYSSNTGLIADTSCIDCPAGSYCTAGSVAVTGLCDPGHWCPVKSGTATENTCPLGTYSASTGLKTENECTVCPLGYICATTALLAPVK